MFELRQNIDQDIDQILQAENVLQRCDTVKQADIALMTNNSTIIKTLL